MRDASNNLCAVLKRRDQPGGWLSEPQSPAAPRCAASNPTPDPRNPVPASPPAAHSSRLTAHSCEAFTLIEIIVVVVIISLLLAIALPVSVGLVKDKQADATRANFDVLKTAIETYHMRRPGQNLGVIVDANYRVLFGHFPPSPTAAVQMTTPVPPALDWTPPESQQTVDKFWHPSNRSLLGIYLGADYLGDAQSLQQFSTIECLLIFLRTYSPEARVIVDRLANVLTNKDNDAIDRNDDDLSDDVLFEMRDAWGTAVQYNFVSEPIVGGRLYKWELRSAGPNKTFLPAFTDEADGDDVVVSGSARSE